MTIPISPDQAWDWRRQAGASRGCNFLPSTAVNTTELWQAESYDPPAIDRELGWARQAGFNSIRVFVQYLVWRADPPAFLRRFDDFLGLAARHSITVMPVLFDDCAFAGREPYLGRQDDPVPGVHNSGWTPSPGLARVADRSAWPDLEQYVRSLAGSFSRDRRVLAWDIYNEPGNSNMGARSLPLLEAAFGWARAADPSQPLTAGAWDDLGSLMSQRLLDLSDVISFHAYDGVAGVEARIAACETRRRPVLCTEWLRRGAGNTFEAVLPLFARRRIGWYIWGLVAGRTQTYMPWGSQPGDPLPAVWQHDVFHPDGRPYSSAELDQVAAFEDRRTNED